MKNITSTSAFLALLALSSQANATLMYDLSLNLTNSVGDVITVGSGSLNFENVTQWSGLIALDLDFTDPNNTWTPVSFGNGTPSASVGVSGDILTSLYVQGLVFGSGTDAVTLSIDFPGQSSDWVASGGAFDPSRSGTLIVTSNDPQPNPAPEPASLALVGLGILGLGVMRRISK